jgi:transcriptional regulator GlxA family with amidase domain
MLIAILLYDGFDELDAIGPFEVFQNAGAAGADCTATLRTVDPCDQITASHGLRVEPDGVLDDVDPDAVVVPGGGWNDRGEAGAWAEAQRGAIPEVVSASHERGATVAGVCTGGMLLARAGVTDGRPAVTHAGALDDLRETDATVVDARVVDDGDVLTAGGVTSGLDLAVHLVAREFGPEIAEQVTTEMEYEPRGEVLQR